MDIQKIEELIKVLEDSRTHELTVRKGEVSVCVRRGDKPKPAPAPRKAPMPQAAAEAPAMPSDEAVITAPMVGLFHSTAGATAKDAEIRAGQVVGSIESMKLLNDVVSDVSGVVIEHLVEDGMPVEYNQPLCRIKLES